MENDEDIDEVHLCAPYNYIRKMPGKGIRNQMTKAFNLWLNIDEQIMNNILSIIELLHNASLMVDDIEDGTVLRRGLPVTHSIYGVPRTINTANYMYFVALSKCLKLNNFEAVDLFTHYIQELHRGQGKEIYWRDTPHCPTEKEYEKMVLQKTGSLFHLPIRLMQLFSGRSYDFTSLIHHISLYFQIRDDYINLCSKEYEAQKGFAEDLTEGKFSFLIIAAVSRDNRDDEILNILKQKTNSYEVKKYCVKLIEERGAFKYALERLKSLKILIVKEIDELGGNEPLLQMINKLDEVLQGKN